MTQRRRPWTLQDQVIAEVAAACGCTLQQIGDCLGRSLSTVSRRIYPSYNQKHLERSRAWRQENAEESRKICRNWKKNNKTRVKELARKRVSKQRIQQDVNNKNPSLQELRRAFEHFGGACAYCGNTEKLTIDHYVPLSRGGMHASSNIVPACLSCNCSKGAKDAEAWYKTRNYFNPARLDGVCNFLLANTRG
jgi:5-methylcytosine-specific restriction endonuclease McrA